MATFELDDDLFKPSGATHVRSPLEGLCRVLTIRVGDNHGSPLEIVGYILYVQQAGQDPHLGD